jgi:hypothetical protein
MGMRLTFFLLIIAAFASAGSVLAADTNGVDVASQTPIFIPASNLRWSELDPAGAPGVEVVDLWGMTSRDCASFK